MTTIDLPNSATIKVAHQSATEPMLHETVARGTAEDSGRDFTVVRSCTSLRMEVQMEDYVAEIPIVDMITAGVAALTHKIDINKS